MTKSRLMSGITLNILVLGVTSLLTDVSSEMIFWVPKWWSMGLLREQPKPLQAS